ncbi:MAG: threonine--tRNA ligase [Candidatus Omnitrophica bacterium]|nr:threonine--tRNA ligase [Candidatus Omnitrophota bacterium]
MVKESLEKLRHSCSHIMASAVKRLFPQAKLGIGPSIENGFYYDFDIPQGLKEEDLPKIEEEMEKIIKKDYPFVHEEWTKEKALKFFEEAQQDYKVELIKEIGEEKVSIYRHGDFIDLCKGPHLSSTGEVKYFKLLSLAGAYWKGKETNPQLLRIYGTAFFKEEDLKKFLTQLKEIKDRDHRRLGPLLRLFDIYQDEAGAGLVFYLEKGAILRRLIEDWEIREHLKRGYNLVNTPHILENKLWKKSGHLDYYQELMYIIDEETTSYAVKPMNCPGHMLIYKSKIRSYRDLPLRIFELGTVYRKEKSGVLHGLLRLRGFTQDDAHIFCREEELKKEVGGVLSFIKEAMEEFGFKEFKAELSTRPESFIGKEDIWEKAEAILEEVLKEEDFSFEVCKGEGAFYGPKIDIKLKDALGRAWQCATVQLDFFLPQRFELYYIDEQGEKRTPVMIHRVILGSLERFLATLIEHYKGAFPFWLSPVQIKVLSLKSSCSDYAKKVKEILDKEFRVEVDLREESLSKKIREAELEKVPYMVVVGEKEKSSQTLNVRTRGRQQLGVMKIEDFGKFLLEKERKERRSY